MVAVRTASEYVPRVQLSPRKSRSAALLLWLLGEGGGARAQSDCGYASKDPHLHFAHGGRADFRGRNGKYYAFFSAPGLAINVKTEDATFKLDSSSGEDLIVDGSFITEVHLVARVGGDKRKQATA